MTPQEIFDKAVQGLLAQGGPAYMTDNGLVQCLYRNTENGRKCAFGQLIPDHLYDANMEGNPAKGIMADYRPILREIGEENTDLVSDIQSAHDNAAMWNDPVNQMGPRDDNPPTDAEWLEAFKPLARAVAEKHGLSAAVLD